MRITIHQTFDISEQNKPLIPIVSNEIGYVQWSQNVIAEALRIAREEALQNDPAIDMLTITEEDITVDTSYNTFIQQFLANHFTAITKNLVSPTIDKFFWLVMQEQANIAKEQLDTAIVTEVTITE